MANGRIWLGSEYEDVTNICIVKRDFVRYEIQSIGERWRAGFVVDCGHVDDDY